MERKRSRVPTATYFDEMIHGAGKQKHCLFGMLSFLQENWRTAAYSLKS
jgi:hypothetical protein